MIDFGAVNERHDLAVLIGKKLNIDPLDEGDLTALFACASDVPVLLDYISELEKRALPTGGNTYVEYGVEGDEGIIVVGTDEHAQRYSSHQRKVTVWVHGKNYDDWAKYRSPWTEKAPS